MKALNLITLVLVIVGALNWGLMGLFQIDLVATLFGGPQATLSRIVYGLVGLSGLYQLIPFFGAMGSRTDNPQRVGSDSAYGTTGTTGTMAGTATGRDLR